MIHAARPAHAFHCRLRSRRALLAAFPLAALLLACAPACTSTEDEPAAVQASAPTHGSWELVYRKPSGEPFHSLEVEQLASVLRSRLEGHRVGVMAGQQGLVKVMLPDVADEETVQALRPRIERIGRLSFEGVAHAGTPGWDEKTERQRLEAWWAAQPEPTLAAYNALPHEDGGPPPSVRWRAHLEREHTPSAFLACERGEIVHPDRDWTFTQADLGNVYPSSNAQGYPAIVFEMRSERREAFGDFSEAYLDELLAIVLDGVVLSAPIINSPLRGPAEIIGRFEQSERDAMIEALRSGPLPTPLELVELRQLPLR